MAFEIALSRKGLAETNWNFEGARPDAIHNVHPYPAKFIPEIPRNLIQQILPSPKYAVMDPFCGSGTTLVEAQRLGYESIGIDLNPIACLISEIKTTPLPSTFLKVTYDCIQEATALRSVELPNIPNLSHWFSEGVAVGITKVLKAINGVSDESVRLHLRFALSSMLVRVSNQDSDTRYAAVTNRYVEDSVYGQFERACRQIAAVKSVNFPGKPRALVLNKDIFTVGCSDIPIQVGLVITSPPYPNAYEYWLYHKYRMWWLGWDPISVRNAEIGARAHYFKKNAATVDEFKIQMAKVCTLVRDILVDGGYYCVVIGRSKIHGIEVDNNEIVEFAARESGLQFVSSIERTIAPSRKSFNLSHARIKKEHILVFRKS